MEKKRLTSRIIGPSEAVSSGAASLLCRYGAYQGTVRLLGSGYDGYFIMLNETTDGDLVTATLCTSCHGEVVLMDSATWPYWTNRELLPPERLDGWGKGITAGLGLDVVYAIDMRFFNGVGRRLFKEYDFGYRSGVGIISRERVRLFRRWLCDRNGPYTMFYDNAFIFGPLTQLLRRLALVMADDA